MTAVPSLLTCDCVGYCANTAGAAAKKHASSPTPTQIPAGLRASLCLLHIVNGSFFMYTHFERSADTRGGAIQHGPILAFVQSRGDRQCRNKRPGVGHCAFKRMDA